MKNVKKKSKPIDWNAYAQSGSEDSEQIALFGWSAENVETYPDLKFMFAIPNGMFTPYKHIAGKMRAMGMRRGVPDILLPTKRGKWSGLYIELKRKLTATQKAGKTSDDQDAYIAYLQSQGYGVIVCYGFEQARDTILQYLNWKDETPVIKIKTSKFTAEDAKQFKMDE